MRREGTEDPETGRGVEVSEPETLEASDWAPETAGTEKVVCCGWSAAGVLRCLTAEVGAWGLAGVLGGKLVWEVRGGPDSLWVGE